MDMDINIGKINLLSLTIYYQTKFVTISVNEKMFQMVQMKKEKVYMIIPATWLSKKYHLITEKGLILFNFSV